MKKDSVGAAGEDTVSLDNELDQYDLLGAGANDDALVPETNLSATAQAFHTRIQRKKKELDKELSEAEKATRARHAMMIRALMGIRKSLRDVTRIDLGERFHFSLLADDWHGWPRLTIKLNDALLPHADYQSLRVSAHDRQARGVIEIDFDSSENPESISLTTESELKRMPNILKKCVRSFLDLTGDIVLEAERKTEEVTAEGALEDRHLDDFHKIEKADPSNQLSGDLFQDDQQEENILDTLPSLEQVDMIPTSSENHSLGKAK